MWVISNATRYETNRGWVRDMSGREVWIVAVRARFRVVPRAEAVWDPDLVQEPVNIAPKFVGSGLTSYLAADSDLVHAKHATDVLMTGYARPRRGQIGTQQVVRMQIGPLDKRVVVFGDRVWSHGRPSKPRPFEAVPLVYTRAFGGLDLAGDRDAPTDWCAENPAGVGYASDDRALEGQLLPNIEDPCDLIRTRSTRPRPTGYGPIMPHWPQRSRYAGTYDTHWETERLPLLPLDFDPMFYQQAPRDQQVPGFLRGGEAVRVEGVHLDGPLEFSLPRISLAFRTIFDDDTVISHAADLHTVVIEPDLPAVSMVWQTHFECHSRVMLLRETRIWQRRRVRPHAGQA